MKNNKIVVSALVAICLVLIVGIAYLNKDEIETVISDDIEEQNIDIEKEVENPNIPEIEPNVDKTKEENIETEAVEEKEEEDKITVPEISKPKEEKHPEEMEKPITQPKPKEPPKPVNEEIKDKENPPTTKQEKNEEVKGGTGDDGVVRDLKGNDLNWGKPPVVEETKGSDLGNPDKNMGEGDKF